MWILAWMDDMDLVKRFPMSIESRRSALIRQGTSPSKLDNHRALRSQFASHAERRVRGASTRTRVIYIEGHPISIFAFIFRHSFHERPELSRGSIVLSGGRPGLGVEDSLASANALVA